jgi:ribosomal protein S18 acetylase RimI-like enzyme
MMPYTGKNSESTGNIPFGEDLYDLNIFTLRVLSDQDEDAYHASKVLPLMDPWHTLSYSSSGLLRYLLRHDPALYRYGIDMSEERAGIVCVRYPWLLGPYIELLAVYPPFQKMGFGKIILEWIESQVCPTSRNIWALVSSFNTLGRKFYNNAGFSVVAPLDDLVRPGYSEILLRKCF